MALIPAGITIAWPSAASAIPDGWARESRMDGRHPKGAAAGVDPGVLGGSATHTHQSTGHTHTIAAHTHGAGVTGSALAVAGGTPETDAAPAAAHTHTTGITGSGSGTSGSSAQAWNQQVSDPPSYGVIWIVSDGTPVGVPQDGLVYWNDSSLPDGTWSHLAATQGRYLKGAATGADGGTTSGAITHTHAQAAHTHTAGHTHTGGTTSATSPAAVALSTAQTGSEAVTFYTVSSHDHTWSAGTGSALPTTTSADNGATSSEPPYREIAIIQQGAATPDAPLGIIVCWLGTIANIPTGWLLCDGTNGTPDLRSTFLKGNTALGTATTGGSVSHGHDSPASHTHAEGHTHDTPTGGFTQSNYKLRQFGVGLSHQSAHAHGGGATDVASGGGATGAGTQDALTTVDTQPAYITVAFLQLAEALDVTVISPADGATITSPGFTVTWAFGGSEVQQSYRLRLYEDASATIVLYDSDTVPTSSQSHTMPSSGILENNTTYHLRVTATDTDGVVGQSAIHDITTSWPAPGAPGNQRARGITDEIVGRGW